MRLVKNGPSATDGPVFSRRVLLVRAAACAAAFTVANIALAKSGLITLHRWQTGNRKLYPFLLAGQSLYLSGESTLESWDITNGRLNWHTRLRAPTAFRPRLDSHVLLAAGRTHLALFRSSDGQLLWEYSSAKELGVPLLHQGRLYIGEAHKLHAFELSSGKRIWSFSTETNTRIAYAPVIFKETLILGPGDGKLYALQISDGHLVWKWDRTRQWQYLRQLQLSQDILIAGGYHDEIYGMRAQNGEILWRFEAGNFLNSQVVTENLVIFWSPTGWIYALAADSGSIRWRYQTTTYKQSSAASNWAPIAAELQIRDGLLYALDVRNILHILEIQQGRQIAQYELPAKVRSFIAPDPLGQDLFFGTETGEILHLRAENLSP